ncbi:unnamed protein product [Chironomus riparius]|uniref:BED-type domain-containing protein n=1 Tax=Chironomus riparius TaxID=315576 RepID=A0A9N9S7X9_9DIPT|nr:unnamed protein product [Chironomus riparius]
MLKVEELNKTKKAGGRPTHEGWNLYHFEKVEGDKGKSVAKCLKCFNHLKNTTISRLLAHRKKCGSVQITTSAITQPTIIQQTYQPVQHLQQQPQTLTITQIQPSSMPQTSTIIQHNTSPQISKIEIEEYEEDPRQEELWTQTQNIETYEDEVVQTEATTMDIIDEDIRRHRRSSQAHKRKCENSSIDGALSSFLIGCNLTFDVVDSKHFKSFVSSLNPDYKIPSSSELTTKVLSQLKGMDSQSGSERARSSKKRKYYSSDSDYD